MFLSTENRNVIHITFSDYQVNNTRLFDKNIKITVKLIVMAKKKISVERIKMLKRLAEDRLKIIEKWNKLYKKREKNLRYIG